MHKDYEDYEEDYIGHVDQKGSQCDDDLNKYE